MSSPFEPRVVKIQFFGAFRRLFQGGKPELAISLPNEVQDIAGLRRMLALQMSEEGVALLSESVFADDTRVLREQDGLGTRKELAVLPPVCGG